MKETKIADAMQYLDEDLLMEAAAYKPRKRTFLRRTLWTAVAACLVVLLAIGGIMKSPQESPFVVSSYALDLDTTMADFPGERMPKVPIRLMELPDGRRAFAFFQYNYYENDPPIVRVMDAEHLLPQWQADQIVSGLELENGKYYCFFIPDLEQPEPYTLPMVIYHGDPYADGTQRFRIMIWETEAGYMAEFTEIDPIVW